MRIIILTTLLLLTGCASQSFDCPAKGGINCARLSEVDAKIDSGTIAKKRGTKEKSPTFVAHESFSSSAHAPLPKRTQEKVLQIILLPYQSKSGIFHQEHRMGVVVEKPRWVMGEA